MATKLFCLILISYEEELYEVSSEVTFEYYGNELIEYDDALNDRNTPAYDWWQNIILPVVSKDVQMFQFVNPFEFKIVFLFTFLNLKRIDTSLRNKYCTKWQRTIITLT